MQINKVKSIDIPVGTMRRPAVLVEKRDVQSKLNTEEYVFHYCGNCGSLIDKGHDIELLNICTYFEVFPAMNQKN